MARLATALLATALVAAGGHRGVVFPAGRPVPGTTITAIQGERRLVTTTDEAGRYEFKELAPGVWLLEAAMFGFQTAHREVNVDSGPSSIEWKLELRPYRTVSQIG